MLLAPGIPAYPGNPPFEMTPVKRIAARRLLEQLAARRWAPTRARTSTRRGISSTTSRASIRWPLELLIGRARVIDLPHRGGITEAHLARRGPARRSPRPAAERRTPRCGTRSDGFHSDYTYLTEGGAKFLVDQGVKVVGVDYLSVEQFKKAGAPAHRMLLGNGVIIIEGLNLSDADAGQYEMYCLPLRIAGADGAPARVVLKR